MTTEPVLWSWGTTTTESRTTRTVKPRAYAPQEGSPHNEKPKHFKEEKLKLAATGERSRSNEDQDCQQLI